MGGSLTGMLHGPLAVLSASLLYALMLERIRFAHIVRTFGDAEEPWWFGYSRDVVTLIGLLSLMAAYRSAGYSDAGALLLGGFVLLVVWGLHEALSERTTTRRALVLTLLAMLPVIAPTLFAVRRLDRLAARLLDALF